MNVSSGQAVGNAITWTKHVLFSPFDIGKWFVLGFCSFLASLGEGVPSANFNTGQGGGSGTDFHEVTNYLDTHLPVIVLVAAIVLAVLIALNALITWLSSRGKFMFVHGVVTNHAAVIEPWHRFKGLGNSLFIFRFWVQTSTGLVFLGVLVLAAFLAWPDLQANRLGGSGTAALLMVAFFFFGVLLPVFLLLTVVDDFVLPVMYLRNLPVMDAIRVFRIEIVTGHFWDIVVFYLLKMAISLAVAVLATIVVCLTCCIAALPYLSSVFLLPFAVFMRSYSLCFLEQFGPNWRLFKWFEPPPWRHGVDDYYGEPRG